MNPVVYAIPVAEPPAIANPTLGRWQSLGYKVIIQIDQSNPCKNDYDAHQVHQCEYRGYPHAVNTLAEWAVKQMGADIVITGGVDITPEPFKGAQAIASEFMEQFPDTFGVMQPIGDDWMTDSNGIPAAARICGSPWMGREFIRRINGGRGPFWPEYFHFFCDEEMKCVTEKLRILWQRPDLNQRHDHWSRKKVPRPPHLYPAKANWLDAKDLFLKRKGAGFPGHEPIL